MPIKIRKLTSIKLGLGYWFVFAGFDVRRKEIVSGGDPCSFSFGPTQYNSDNPKPA